MVARSTEVGTPVIFVAMNYRCVGGISFPLIDVDCDLRQAQRYINHTSDTIAPTDFLAAFGFLAGEEVKAAGVSNLGLRDRKLVFCYSPPVH